MDTFSWVLVGLIGVCLALYFIFTFAKKIEIIQKITTCIIIPAIGTLYIYFLLDFIPDSLHTLKISVLSFSLLTISFIFGTFSKSKGGKILERFTFLLSILTSVLLYKSIFLIHRIPLWLNIIVTVAYFTLFFLFFIIFIRKASVRFYIYGILALIISAFINYCSILNLFYTPEAFSIIRLLGTTGLLAYLIFELLNHSVLNLKLKKLISLMILLASLVLICLSNLMILY